MHSLLRSGARLGRISVLQRSSVNYQILNAPNVYSVGASQICPLPSQHGVLGNSVRHMSFWKNLKERIQAEAEKEESLKESLNKLEETFKRKEKKDEIPLEEQTKMREETNGKVPLEDKAPNKLSEIKEQMSAKTMVWWEKGKAVTGNIWEKNKGLYEKIGEKLKVNLETIRQQKEIAQEKAQEKISESKNVVGGKELKGVLLQWHRLRLTMKDNTSKFMDMFKKTKDEKAGKVKETVTKSAEPLKDWVSSTSKVVVDTVKDSEVAKQAQRVKTKVDRYVKDPTTTTYRPPGPIRPDDEMKALTQKEQAIWKKQLQDIKGRIESTKAYRAVSDVKMTLEESQNPLVQRGLDVVDNIASTADRVSGAVLGETEEGQVISAIQKYVPGFDVDEFLLTLSEKDGLITKFTKAQNETDMKELQTMCTELNMVRKELILERMKTENDGLTPKVNILWIDDPEMIKAAFNESSELPQLVIMFNMQCYEEFFNSAGELVRGGMDECKQVRMLWVLQYDPERGWLVHEDMIGATEAIW